MKTILFLLSALISFSAYCQNNLYQAGYIVRENTKDSVLISIKEENLSRGIPAIKQQKKVTLYPTAVDTVTFSDGRTFVSAHLPVDHKEKLFAQLIFKGKISMLFFNDSEHNKLLLLQKDEQLIKLPKNSKQRGLLAYLMRDCKEVAKKARSSSGNFKSRAAIISLLKSYHQCISPDAEFKEYPSKKYRTEFGFLAGISYHNFVRNRKESANPMLELDRSSTPLAGVYLEQRFTTSISLQPELSYMRQRVINDSIKHPVNHFSYSSYDIRLNKIQLFIPLKYRIVQPRSDWYLKAGPAVQLINGKQVQVLTQSSSQNPVVTDTPIGLKNYALGFSVALGYSSYAFANRLGLEFRYTRTNIASDSGKFLVNAYQVVVDYRLN